jgi:hypothetical protein
MNDLLTSTAKAIKVCAFAMVSKSPEVSRCVEEFNCQVSQYLYPGGLRDRLLFSSVLSIVNNAVAKLHHRIELHLASVHIIHALKCGAVAS